MEHKVVDGIPTVTVEQVQKLASQNSKVRIIDVRRPDEFTGELGHIEGAELIPLGPDLADFFNSHLNSEEPTIFVCRSGGRSAQATNISKQAGFKNSYNMAGGMLLWNQHGFDIVTTD